MNLRPLVLSLLLAPALVAQSLSKLPTWAREPAMAALDEPAPEADAWVLLDRTEFAYRGDGEIRKRHVRVVRVLTERGLDQGLFVAHGLGWKTSVLKRLKGWNLRPDGELETLERDYTVTVAAGNRRADTLTVGQLPRVAKGSFVAFESEEAITDPMGPLTAANILEPMPIRIWELELVKAVGWFTRTSAAAVTVQVAARHFQPWCPAPAPGSTSLRLTNLPALPRHEGGHPDGRNALPWVYVTFTDPSLATALRTGTWDELARWYSTLFDARCQPLKPEGLAPATGTTALVNLHRWLLGDFAFKDVYLTPERNWTPEPATEVVRLRFGDCKDLAGLLLAAARGAGFTAHPVLARINEGTVDPDEPVGPYAFNHAIAAVRLEQSAGLASEVVTPQGRFLLVDPTNRFVPLGQLSASHRGRRVLICTPTGGLWAQVPEAATRRPAVTVRVEAQENEGGRLTGTLAVTADGGALGLRHLALGAGPKGVKDRLVALLALPPGATLDLAPLDDPKAEQDTYQVRATFDLPRALEPNGSEFLLPRLGLPGNPWPIQRPGQPRRWPVALEPLSAWDYQGVFRLATPARPVTPAETLATPLRDVTWTARSEGPTCTLRFTQAGREVAYPHEQREQGVQDQRQDWQRWQVFLEDALSVTR